MKKTVQCEDTSRDLSLSEGARERPWKRVLDLRRTCEYGGGVIVEE